MTAIWLALVVGTVAISLLATSVILVRRCLAVVTVTNQSMLPTLQHGDRVLLVRYWPSRWLRRGTIVVVWPWPSPPASRRWKLVKNRELTPFVKRITGTPGDTLRTSINEVDDAQREALMPAHDREGKRSWHIPEGHLFVQGDNPNNSIDSLTWGPVPKESVLGVVVMRLAQPRHGRPDPVSATPYLPSQTTSKSMIGQPAPNFRAETTANRVVELATYAGRRVMFLFVSPGCRPCYEIFRRYEALRGLAAGAGEALVLVSAADQPATQAFTTRFKIDSAVIVAPRRDNSFLNDYGVTSIPRYMQVDEEGVIRGTGNPTQEWGDWPHIVEGWERSSTYLGEYSPEIAG